MLRPKIIAPVLPILIDKRFPIRVKSLEPFQRFTIRTELKSEKNEVFESFGNFMADSSGKANLSTDPSFGGSYTGTDGMGLFWSMVQAPNQRKGLRFVPTNVEKPINYDIQLYNGHVTSANTEKCNDGAILAYKTVPRTCMAPNVERIEISVGRIRGTLFLPKGEGKFPVIDMFGPHFGLVEHRASLLASHGFATLALAFLAYKDLPRDLNDIELEYFIEAVEWLSKHERVNSNGIGYIGVSHGGQLALQVAAECNSVKAVVGISSQTSVVLPVRFEKKLLGFHTSFLHSLKEERKEIRDECVISKACLDNQEDFLMKNQIKAEDIVAEIMLITGEDDQCIRSVKFANQMKERLLQKKPNKRIIHLLYPNAGHLIEPPYLPLCPASFHKVYNCLLCWGGRDVEQNAVQEHAWKSLVAFLKRNLVETSNNTL